MGSTTPLDDSLDRVNRLLGYLWNVIFKNQMMNPTTTTINWWLQVNWNIVISIPCGAMIFRNSKLNSLLTLLKFLQEIVLQRRTATDLEEVREDRPVTSLPP